SYGTSMAGSPILESSTDYRKASAPRILRNGATSNAFTRVVKRGMVMEFRILGELEVVSDAGEPLSIRPQHRAIICVLLVLAQRDRPVRTDELTRMLSEETATAPALKSAVSKVRGLLPDRLPAGHRGYQICLLPGDTVDLLEFGDLVRQARLA